MPFKQMVCLCFISHYIVVYASVLQENITAFLRGARALGMAEHDLFTTVALFEAKDMFSVVLGIHAFARCARKNGFNGPVLGPKEADKNVGHAAFVCQCLAYALYIRLGSSQRRLC